MAPKKPQPKLTKTQAAMAWLGNRQLVTTQSYLERGRQLAPLPDDALRERFIDDFKRYAADPHNDALRRVHADNEVEFRLRKIEPPYEAVQAERDALIALAASAMADAMGEAEPLDNDTARRVRDEIAALIESLPGDKKSAN
jgi:hypothetical protein